MKRKHRQLTPGELARVISKKTAVRDIPLPFRPVEEEAKVPGCTERRVRAGVLSRAPVHYKTRVVTHPDWAVLEPRVRSSAIAGPFLPGTLPAR
jgi:hypothetical protein